ncbi:Gfo/Idh/MocA family oxidoreductase [Candidatus Woesearchaeota archaeon]|nr:Gfo/Idh/MocA family oxidoreductase [Candidatus Woesearchaeota archaeon]
MRHKLRVGFIGAGDFSYKHFQALNIIKGFQLVAVCDQNLSKATRFAEYAGDPSVQVYDSHHDLLKTELDAVLVCTPPSATPFIAEDCLTRGLHTLIEKPIALDLSTADKLLATYESARVNKQGLVAMVNFVYRGEPGFIEMSRLIRAGVIGMPQHYLFEKNNEVIVSRKDESRIVNNYFVHNVGPNFMAGIHYLFFLSMIYDPLPVQRIAGHGIKFKKNYQVCNSDRNWLLLRDGSTAEIGVTWASVGTLPHYYDFALAAGRSGTLYYNREAHKLVVDTHRKRYFPRLRGLPRLACMWSIFRDSIMGEEVSYFPDLYVARQILAIALQMNSAINCNGGACALAKSA